jgi:hypothetical protein
MPYPPDLTIELPENEWGTFALLVYDESGLVIGGQSAAPGSDGTVPSAVAAQPERNELVVTWTGGACSHQPYLRVRGDARDLNLVIAPAPIEISFTAADCPAVGIPQTVTLSLSGPVDQTAVEITEIR